MSSVDPFRQAEDEYLRLKGQLAAGRITREQFDAALKQLMIPDAQGRHWMIGPDSGKWYVHDGQNWVEAQPPSVGGYVPAAPPIVQAQSYGAARSNTLLIAMGAIVVVCLVAVIALLFASSQGILKIGLASPTNTPIPTFAPLIPTALPTVAAPPTAIVIVVTPTGAPPTTIPTTAPAPTIPPTVVVTPTASANDLIAQADALTFQSKFAEAAALYQRVAQMDSTNALAYARWARMLDFQAYLEERGELSKLAVSNAETAAQLAPNNAEVQIRLARAYDWNGTYDKALTAAQNAVRLAPNSAEAYAILAEALNDNNKLADAETAALRALQLDPNSAEGHRIMGFVLYAKQQVQGAIPEIEKAAQAEPNLAVRHYELGSFYRVAKDYTKAMAAYQRVIALYPQAASAYVGLGRVALDQKQYDQAIENFTRATQINDKSASAYYRLGQAYYEADRCPQAIPAFQKTIELNPKANLAMNSLGWCYLKAGDLTAAADWAKKAAALNPTDADTKALQAALATALATPTPQIPPGLYVIGLRSEPAAIQPSTDVGFYVTFLNNTNGTQNYRWLVYIYRADNLRNSFGETAAQTTSIPVGTVEQKALGIWRVGVGTCGNYVARVAWLDVNRRATPFSKPDGQVYELPFAVCP